MICILKDISGYFQPEEAQGEAETNEETVCVIQANDSLTQRQQVRKLEVVGFGDVL